MRTYEERLALLGSLIDQYGKIGQELYDLFESRHRGPAAQLAREIKALFVNLPHGIGQLSLSALANEDVRFLEIDINGPEGNITYCQRLMLTELVVVKRDDGFHVVNAVTGADCGRLSAASWTFPDDEEVMRATWLAPYFASRRFSTRNLLPLAGASILKHPIFSPMARFARAVLTGGQISVQHLNAVDKQAARLHTLRNELTAKADAIVFQGIDRDKLDARHVDLAQMMRRHDWTWDYADRPDYQWSDNERTMIGRLLAIDPCEALALWHLHSYSPMQLTAWKLAAGRKDVRPIAMAAEPTVA